MRLFVATSIIVLFFASPPSRKQQQPETQNQQPGTAVTPYPGGGVTVIVNQPPAAQQTESPKQNPQNCYGWVRQWFAPTTLLSLALVIIAGIAAKVGLDSLEQVRQQAESTEKAANAARDNAEAVMRGERAWLLIEKIESVEPDFANRGIPLFHYWVVNRGKTPGFMISANAYVQPEDNNECPSNFDFMERVDGLVDDSVIIPNGEPLKLWGNDVPAGDHQFQSSDISNEQRAGLFTDSPSTYLWAVGCIRYHDVFGKLHTTPFAYWYDAKNLKFVRSSWPEVNKPK